MNLTALLPEQMLIDLSYARRLRAMLSAVSDQAYLAAVEKVSAIGPLSGGGRQGYKVQGGVAIIDMRGVFSKEFSLWGLIFGGQVCTEWAVSSLAAALEDQEAKSILLYIDSPGGDIRGLDELAEAVYAARGKKPIVALGADRCMSAAYWVACQADRLYVTSNSLVGSIGVRMEVRSFDRAERNEGIDSRIFASVREKKDPDESSFDAIVDSLAANFVAAVARGRGIPEAEAQALADARVYIGKEAVASGCADEVTTLTALVGRLQAETSALPPQVVVEVDPLEEECAPPPLGNQVRGMTTDTTRSDGNVTPGAEQKEAPMSDVTKADLESVVKALGEATAQIGDLRTAVSEMKAERELDALIAQAKADRKIQNPETEASVRTVGAKSLDAAKALVSNLKASGPDGGSIVDGAGSAAAENGKTPGGRGVVSIDQVREYAKAHGIDTREALSRLTRRSA